MDQYNTVRKSDETKSIIGTEGPDPLKLMADMKKTGQYLASLFILPFSARLPRFSWLEGATGVRDDDGRSSLHYFRKSKEEG